MFLIRISIDRARPGRDAVTELAVDDLFGQIEPDGAG